MDLPLEFLFVRRTFKGNERRSRDLPSFRNVSFPGRVSLGQSPRASCESRDYRPQRFPLREASEEILLRQGFGGSRRLRRVLTAAAKSRLSRLFQTIPEGPHHANGKQRTLLGNLGTSTVFVLESEQMIQRIRVRNYYANYTDSVQYNI